MKGFGFDITVVNIYCAYKKRNCAQNKFNGYEILAYTMYAFLFYCTYIIIYGFERKHIFRYIVCTYPLHMCVYFSIFYAFYYSTLNLSSCKVQTLTSTSTEFDYDEIVVI